MLVMNIHGGHGNQTIPLALMRANAGTGRKCTYYLYSW